MYPGPRASHFPSVSQRSKTAQKQELTAVSVVFPWSTCPMVPMFTCGFVRSKVESSEALGAPGNRGSAGATRVARRALLSLNDSAHFDRVLADARLAARRSAILCDG